MSESLSSNVAEFSVSELSQALKRTLEDSFGRVRVRGELGRVSRPASGHIYCDLKDDRSVLSAVIWKGTLARLAIRPEEGLEVIATGRITTFPGQSKYQMVIDEIEPAGAGALMALLDERRRRLAAEGLFDEARKQVIPYMPRVIGVVTSPTGAVIRDIIHRISDRFPVHVIVWPVRVQGETSAAEVAAAIDGFNGLEPGGPIAQPDVLIVARGGGSLEDLWGFNEEIVVRAAARSMIPLISAIGHETDTTLIDHAADRRAPTPTGAAEMAVPVKVDVEAQLAQLSARLSGAMRRLADRRRDQVRALSRALPQPEQMLAVPRQRLDTLEVRLGGSLRTGVDRRRATLDRLGAYLSPVRLEALLRNERAALSRFAAALPVASARFLERRKLDLARATQRLSPVPIARLTVDGRRRTALAATRLDRASQARLERLSARLGDMGRLLRSYSHEAVLERGFVLALDQSGSPVHEPGRVKPGEALTLRFAGARELGVVAVGGPGSPEKAGKEKQTRKPRDSGGQDTLF